MKELLVHIIPISELPFMHSDRIFGAICVAIKDLYGEEKLIEMIENFKKEPPFLLSSAFPYIYHNRDRIYFLPKPIEDIEMFDNYKSYIDNHKKFKKVKYISKDIFNDWINGRINETYIIKNIDKYNIKTVLLFPKEKILKFDIGPCDVPRNRINRINNSSNLFYVEGNSYKNANLYFIIRIYDHKYEELLKSSLKFLQDYRGFGKSISVGKGKFEIDGEFSENKLLDIPNSQKRFITLSRYIPSDNEINLFKIRDNIYYEIDTKRGMVTGDKPKKQVHFFVEGSTFPNTFPNLKNIYGRILYVHDDEKSVEYGFAFNVDIIKNTQGLRYS